MMDAVELTKKLVSIDSTDPGKYEIDIESFIKEYINNINNKNIKIYESEVLSKRKNLMAVFTKDNNYVISDIHDEVVFICHMDTVVVGNDWTKNAFDTTEIGGRLYGRGTTDMKSGIAVALSVFKYICEKYKNENLSKDFKIIFTVDEEANMRGVEKVIEDKWVSNESYVCDLEPTDKTIQVSHKGRFWIKLKVKGKTAHASMPNLGIDANAALAECITYIRKEIDKLPEDDELGKTSVTFGLMAGGYQPYVVPDESYVYMDFRLTPPTTDNDIIRIINDAISYTKNSINEKVDISYEITGDRAFVKKDVNSQFLKVIVDTLNDLYNETNDNDFKPVVTYFSGYTDTAVIASMLKNHETFSYGPGSLALAHKPDEYVDIKDIKRCELVYKKLIENLIL